MTTMARRRSSHSVLKQVADLMRITYRNERSLWYALRGREVGDLRVDDETWSRMAQFMLTNRVENYMAFVHMQFEALGVGSTCPPPKQCYGPAALARWTNQLDRSQKAEHDAQFALDFQRQHMQGELLEAQALGAYEQWTPEAIDRYVLFNDENQLTSLFRYCVAIKSLRPDVAALYEDEAVIEYLFGRDSYDVVWGELIPETLRERASRMTLAGYLD